LQLYANPKTRFKGICWAWCGLHEASGPIAKRLADEYATYFDKGGQLKMADKDKPVQEEDGVMVKLGRTAAMIQQYPKEGFRASNSEQKWF
jgi:hypothetical protein